jgi:hypothetical protein
MPELRRVQEILTKGTPSRPRAERWGIPFDMKVFAETERRRAEREVAPVITRDAVLAMLDEARTTTRLARRTLWVALATLSVGAATLAASLVVLLR